MVNKQYKTKPRWTFAQVQFLKKNVHNMTDDEIALHLGKTRKSIERKRDKLNIRKLPGRGVTEVIDPTYLTRPQLDK